MVEFDPDVAAVWHTVLEGEAEWLADRVANFELTQESVERELATPPSDQRDRAFHTLLRNRVNRGGILAPGAGLLKYGENGKGVASRWYPSTLRKRIIGISHVRDRIRFIEGDGLQVLRENALRSDAAFLVDPPYTAAGKKAGMRLYAYSEIDHEELFRVAATLRGSFLMTYDNSDEIVELAHRHGFETVAVPMQNTHLTKMTELLVGRNLDWARDIGEPPLQQQVYEHRGPQGRLFSKSERYQVETRGSM